MTGLAGPHYDAPVSFRLPFEPEGCLYVILAMYVIIAPLQIKEGAKEKFLLQCGMGRAVPHSPEENGS